MPTKPYCVDCFKGWLHPGTPKGTEESIAGLPTYVSKPENPNGKNILIVVDIFGYKVPNSRLLADEYASRGYTVYFPDILDNDPAAPELLLKYAPNLEKKKEMSQQEIDDLLQEGFKSFGPWAERHKPEVVDPKLEGIIKALESKGPLGLVGFCWGVPQAFRQAEGKFPNIKAVAGFHPTAFSGEMASKTVVPAAIGCGTEDALCDDKNIKEIKDGLAKTKVDHEVKIFPNQTHGFATRADLSSEDGRIGHDDAREFLLGFFDKHL